MISQIIPVVEVECDFPECPERIIMVGQDYQWPDFEYLKFKGWEVEELIGDSSPFAIYLCPKCKGKEFPTDIEMKFHDCLFSWVAAGPRKDGRPRKLLNLKRCYYCHRPDPNQK